ncbi:hypothetical protein CXG81DRAFT_23446 [Caulochytrium protostelioides]|uniref:FHA domain-containing protein n=1 Tax=Caulochytrium protostelioides TaxID=1555241 RepID=A0A4P9XFG6_9FUNG|nr:hypothetical protein CXG81DRAFT_23446 [Caulochytrium protostelioides]|eukprot:RKP03890.1 hypothetical protein CXG81DRAFT_23446 [Caulochytrium protostelioides]
MEPSAISRKISRKALQALKETQLSPILRLESVNATFDTKLLDLLSPIKVGRSIPNKTVPETHNGTFDSKVLSRNHAEIWYDAGQAWIRDVKSSNGTFINGQRLSDEGEMSAPFPLNHGDLVEFGIDISEPELDSQFKRIACRAYFQDGFNPPPTAAAAPSASRVAAAHPSAIPVSVPASTAAAAPASAASSTSLNSTGTRQEIGDGSTDDSVSPLTMEVSMETALTTHAELQHLQVTLGQIDALVQKTTQVAQGVAAAATPPSGAGPAGSSSNNGHGHGAAASTAALAQQLVDSQALAQLWMDRHQALAAKTQDHAALVVDRQRYEARCEALQAVVAQHEAAIAGATRRADEAEARAVQAEALAAAAEMRATAAAAAAAAPSDARSPREAKAVAAAEAAESAVASATASAVAAAREHAAVLDEYRALKITYQALQAKESQWALDKKHLEEELATLRQQLKDALLASSSRAKSSPLPASTTYWPVIVGFGIANVAVWATYAFCR